MPQVSNPRQGMEMYAIWLTKAEEESMKESLDDMQNNDPNSKTFGYAETNVAEIISTAQQRGDFFRR